MTEVKKKTTKKTQATKTPVQVNTESFLSQIAKSLYSIDITLGALLKLQQNKDVDHEEKIGRPPQTTLENLKKQVNKSVVQDFVDKEAETKTKEETKQPVLINQAGEVTKIDFETLKEEANKLVSIEKETSKAGFYKAREIILSSGVDKLDKVPQEKYTDLITQFRKAVSEWK